MSFWKTSGYKFQEIVQLPEEKLLLLVNSMSREDLIAWLSWNDQNGIYSDSQSMKAFGRVMSREEGMEILLRLCEENRV